MDRYIVSLVDSACRVWAQTTPGIPLAQVPDAVDVFIKGKRGMKPLQIGWTITVCKDETVQNLHLTDAQRDEFGLEAVRKII